MHARPRHIRLPAIALVVATILATVPVVVPPAAAVVLGAAQRVSVGYAGQASGVSVHPAVSGDGRFVAFQSEASNLVSGDVDGSSDIFVRDTVSKGTVCVSVRSDGSPAGAARSPSVDNSGYVVAFESESPELAATDNNGDPDVFVRNLATKTTACVSINAAGIPANGTSHFPVVSADGRYVAFLSNADDLGGSNDVSAFDAVYVRDLRDGVTRQVSLTLDGSALDGHCSAVAISADGRYVAFASASTNLVAGDTNGMPDVFLRDMQTGAITLVSVTADDKPGNLAALSPAISGDGRYIAFESQASNLVAGDGNGVRDVFVRDRIKQTTTRASVSMYGAEGDGDSRHPSFSGTGRYLAFESGAKTLVPGDTNGVDDVFVRDTMTASTVRVSLTESGTQASGSSSGASLSSDGMYAAFFSQAGDLVAGDTNGVADVFVSPTVAFKVERLEGPDRFGTASAAALRAFPRSEAVVIATGRNFPDALGGSALAGVEDAPVLLVEPTSVPATTAAAITRLAPKRVFILGSERAVSAGVATAIQKLVPSAGITRIGGADRYATASLIANRVVASPAFDGIVYVATGGTYPDALAVSPLACLHQRPVVLVPPAAAGAPALPSGTRQAVVLGSTAAVSAGVFNDLESRLGKGNVSRIGGSDRYATAALIAAAGVEDGLSFDGVALATGMNFPDALSGGPVCARLGAVMLLTRDTSLPTVTENALASNAAWINTLRVFGSTFAVAEAVVTRARTALGK